MPSYILNSTSLILFLNGKPVKVSKDAPVYAAIIKAFRLPEEQQEAAILAALDKQSVNKNIEEKGFIINGDEVIFEGEKLPAPLAQNILSLIKENLPVELFKNFWRNLKKNPSRQSVLELYDFLSHKEMPLTEDGCFLAYRGLQKNFYSVHGNLETKVLKGKVNSSGQIYNGVGEEIEIERNSCDDNRDRNCSSGLHSSGFSYAQRWSRGRLVVVKVNPKDVVSVPTDYDCQKLRCCAYTVISEIKEEIIAPMTSKSAKPVTNTRFKKDEIKRSNLTNRVSSYLDKKKSLGYRHIPVKSIQGIFSPSCPSQIEILDAVVSLGYVWKENEAGSKQVTL